MKKLRFCISIFLISFMTGFFLIKLLVKEAGETLDSIEFVEKVPQPIPVLANNKIPDTHNNLIVHGQSVGHLILGDSREKAVQLFGRLDTEYNHNSETILNCSERKELRFLDLEDKTSPFHFDYGNGAFVYLRNDKIEQIKIESEKFKTQEGLTVGSTPKQVRRHYPNIKTFVLINSKCNCTGGRNLIYWIDEEKGIAFEFHYWRNKKARRLSYIYIFQQKTKFLPEGCLYLETQGWQEIEPFSLEEPKGMQEEWMNRNIQTTR